MTRSCRSLIRPCFRRKSSRTRSSSFIRAAHTASARRKKTVSTLTCWPSLKMTKEREGTRNIKVSDLFVKCLKNEGVKYVFGLPGEEIEAFLFSLEQSSFQFIPPRHEQGAAFMADVWGRLTGKAGVPLAALGPGATNLVTGDADAN